MYLQNMRVEFTFYALYLKRKPNKYFCKKSIESITEFYNCLDSKYPSIASADR